VKCEYKFILAHIIKECNGKPTVEYEMFNKQWVINEIFSEKAKKVINVFGSWEVKFYRNSMS